MKRTTDNYNLDIKNINSFANNIWLLYVIILLKLNLPIIITFVVPKYFSMIDFHFLLYF
jgi:hypothetical protein